MHNLGIFIINQKIMAITINQALDKIFIDYKLKDVENFPDIQTLKQNLVELKLTWGGNTQVENEETINNVIRTGSANPDDWS